MKHLTLAATAVALTATPVFASSITDVFTSYYAFGDSLTDDGKLGQLEPPSLEGRFSNGPTYAEIVADVFEDAGRDTANIALGGATAGGEADITDPLSNFAGQVQSFQAALFGIAPLISEVLPTLTFDMSPVVPGDNPLVSVFFGANDIFQAQPDIDPQDPTTIDRFLTEVPAAAAAAIADNIRTLAATPGGLFNDFLVLGLPNLGDIPAFVGNEALGFGVTASFNAQLAGQIGQLEAEGLNIISFDTDSVFQEILADIRAGGTEFSILDATTPCTIQISANLDPTFDNPFNCVDQGVDPNQRLFVDAVHPNGVAQALVGDRVLEAVRISTVPLPAGAPLYLLALAGIGMVARRRR